MPLLNFTNPVDLAREARRELLAMANSARTSHVASALSVVDILSVLYCGGANIYPNITSIPNRDIVILSKGHAASALYAVLALQGFFPLAWLKEYCMNGAHLGGHVSAYGVPGVELSTGSLGHGLPYGVGIAISKKLYGLPGTVFVVLSDGECDEGTTWESALLANHHGLDNLTVIVDRNMLQSLESTEKTLRLEPFSKKWKSFGWNTVEISGHNYESILSAIRGDYPGPKCIIASTIKGKGIDFMENSVEWHYKSPSDIDLQNAIMQLGDGN